MKDSDKIERTVFLEKCMVYQIAQWFLMEVFENKELESHLRDVWRRCKGNAETAGLLFLPLTHNLLDQLYYMYVKAEKEEEEELEAEEEELEEEASD